VTRIPRIIALLSWYDEHDQWLSACITSLIPHVDHVIAVDGAYGLFPEAKPQSRSDQATAIVETCHAASIGLTLHRPQHVWIGNEIEKRNRLFRLAELEAEPDDWYFVVDADCILEKAPHDLRQQLADTEHDNATISVWERGDPYRNKARLEYESTTAVPADCHYTVRALFRAIPGLHVAGAHYRYVTPDGRLQWGHPLEGLEPTLMLNDGLMMLEHRTHYRPKQRHQDAWAYYKRRDDAGIEAGIPAADAANEAAKEAARAT
jgi:hypothetical protein